MSLDAIGSVGGSHAPGEAGYLSIEALSKHHGAARSVDSLSLSIEKGELVALLGPSGCGKTTTLRMIAGLTPATSGRILVAGNEVTAVPTHKRDMGLVFQSYALFPHLTIAQNVAFGLEMRRLPRVEIRTRVAAALEMVHLSGREDRKPSQLSGGQQQRVALARALVIKPSILLLDEPLSNLDAKLRDEMRNEIRDIQTRLGITAVFVTHDQVEALAMCDKVAVMEAGRLSQVGTPEDVYERPANPFVASFVGRINRVAVEGRGNNAVAFQDQLFRTEHSVIGPATMMVRPHRVAIGTDDGARSGTANSLRGHVVRVTYVGDLLQYDVDIGGTSFMVEAATRGIAAAFRVRDAVRLEWQPADTLVFGAAP
ncbi:putative spermidine/putrescine transport system ATP-binding protein [Bosea sp. OK403]|uniref:ABC transporter ATP-binding protein n=1 Tax=Bosea sp. OK403 TaxID=1855286 RepID=UPI0008F446D8|nr:ABC transporter ATP-binding protein [Bosea sp. OK403]SFI48648.1 putative spermidine/putrescine transport system ATP-binding protein [Bosea sp. OK403]